MLASRCRHLGADRGAHRNEQRKGGESVKVVDALRLDQIAVEHDVCGCPESALDQIHQQKSQVVEYVACCDAIVEFDRVEQDGLAVDQRHITEVQVAVTAAHQTRALAGLQQRFDAIKCVASGGGHGPQVIERKKIRFCG